MGWDHHIELAALAFTAVMILSPRSTAIGLLRLHDRFGLGAAGDAVTPLARMIGALVTVAAGASVTGFLITWAAAEFVTVIMCWWAAAKVTGYRLRPIRLVQSVRQVPKDNPGIWHFISITNVGSTLSAGTRQIMVVPVGLVAGPSSAGAFRLAAQIGQAIAKSAQMLARSLFAELARVHVSQDHGELIRLFRATCIVTGTAGAIIILSLSLFGGEILALIAGDRFEGAHLLLLLLGMAAALDVAGIGFEPALLATGRASLSFRLTLVGTGTLVLLMIWLLPTYGVTGAACAMLIGSALTAALLGIAAWRTIHQPANEPS
jgi:O-antigen/teichoic acid export membrane protein